MIIRRFEEKDLDRVAELFNEYRIFYKQDTTESECKSFIEKRIKANESIIFVAEENNKIIGFTQIYPLFDSLTLKKGYVLYDLFVDKDYRQSGVGSQLLETSFSFAKDHDAAYVWLETDTDNYTAQKLYRKMGMHLENETELSFRKFF